MKKKILIITPISLLILIFIILIYPIISNDKYHQKLLEDVKNNTQIKSIEYLNKDNNYYILISNNEIIVLDLNYEEVLKKNKEEIKDSPLDLVYRHNNLYYEKKQRKGKKIIYEFYDTNTLELVREIKVGG